MKAILYARFSPRPNAAECESIQTQFDRLRAWCSSVNYEIAGEYSDADRSGATTDKRPELENALRHVCRIRGVLCVYSLSRLSRNTRDAILIAERLERRGADLASLHERIDTATPMGRFYFAITASLGQLEREQISARTSDAMIRYQSSGRRMGRTDRCPFGMRPAAEDTTALEPDEAEQEIIGRIIDMAARGMTHRGICRELDRQGIERRGKRWDGAHSLVAGILRKAGVEC